MKKIWITGAGGHVGQALERLLDCRQYEIFATDHKEVDITDIKQVHSYANLSRPDVVINCAGLTDLSTCEQNVELAYRTNALGARNLAQETQAIGGKLIQISTDDVFSQDGTMPYNEFDPVAPCTIYGKSKYAGEQLVKDLTSRYIIVRSSWVYGTGNDFVSTVLQNAKDGVNMNVASNQYACPTSAKELANVILQFIENDAYGTYHAVCKGHCSRYELAKEILSVSGQTDAITLTPVVDSSKDRPSFSVLDNLMLRISDMQEPTDWKTALKAYIEETGGLH